MIAAGGRPTPPSDRPDLPSAQSRTSPRLERSGLAWLIGGFLFCPCHLPLTLWALTSILSGSALAFVTRHTLGVAAGITLLWAGATAYGFRQLFRAQRMCGVSILIALALAGMPSAGLAQARGASVADTVRAQEMGRAQILLNADTTALSRQLASEFVEISRLGQLRTRADNLHDIASGQLKLRSVKYDSLTVQVYGDVAVVRGIADNTGTFLGMPFSGKLRFTRVLVRRDGRWQAVAMQHTMMP